MKRKTYFAIIEVCLYNQSGKSAIDRLFIHFSFKSRYHGEEDCSQHDEDLWKTFHKLPAVIEKKELLKHYSSPHSWNYIRELEEVNVSDIVMNKWVNSSPFYYDHKWQYKRIDS